MHTISITGFGHVITVELSDPDSAGRRTGHITSDLRDPTSEAIAAGEDSESDYNYAVHGLESLILAHACNGVDIESGPYVAGVIDAIVAIANHCG